MTIKRKASISWFYLIHSSYCFRSIFNACLSRSVKADYRTPLTLNHIIGPFSSFIQAALTQPVKRKNLTRASLFPQLQTARPDRPATATALPARDAAAPPAPAAPDTREHLQDIGGLASLGRRHLPALGQPLGGSLAAAGRDEPDGDGAFARRRAQPAHALLARQSPAGPGPTGPEEARLLAAAEPQAAPDPPALLARVIRARLICARACGRARGDGEWGYALFGPNVTDLDYRSARVCARG